MKVSISENANNNYLAEIVQLENVMKHPEADRLQVVEVAFNTVVTGMEAKDGDYYVFFPPECQISDKFLRETNSYRDAELNAGKDVGFFEKNGRVKAQKLRGIISTGYIVPIKELARVYPEFLNDWSDATQPPVEVGLRFDTIGDELLLKKYFKPIPETSMNRNGKKPRISRLVKGQVHLHLDTDNLKYYVRKLDPSDNVIISYKLHGTSFWVSNVLVKKKKTFWQKIFKKEPDTNYDIVYGSRRVVKNEAETQNKQHYYGEDLWGHIAEEIGDRIPKGFSVYGECVGYTPSGAFIQSGYDYGCEQGKYKLYIYRVTFTNVDGEVFDLSQDQMNRWCEKQGFEHVPVKFSGTLQNYLPMRANGNKKKWQEKVFKKLKEDFTKNDCYLCNSNVPEEGIVLRSQDTNNFVAYKLKGDRFLEKESKDLDSEAPTME